MKERDGTVDSLLDSLQERAKELNCLYRVDEALSAVDASLESVGQGLIDAIPPGWQYPDLCRVRVVVSSNSCQSPGFSQTPWNLKADIFVLGEKAGEITVEYSAERPTLDEGPFLKEERRLINAIAERIGLFLMQRRVRNAHADWQNVQSMSQGEGHLPVILDFLKRTDPKLLAKMTRKMINQLCWVGVAEARQLLTEFLSGRTDAAEGHPFENRPRQRSQLLDSSALAKKTFELASKHFGQAELASHLQSWLNAEKSSYLIDALENPLHGLGEIAEAMSRFEGSGGREIDLPIAVRKSLCTSLLRRLFSDQFSFIQTAKQCVTISDFFEPLRHVIHPPRSYGKLGGKSAGVFLASRIIGNDTQSREIFQDIRFPKTWHLSSDTLVYFLHYNNLEDLYDRKYLEIDRIRLEYPYVVQVLKNSHFPPDILRGLAVALDDFEDRPIIVRSSSLLEDREGSAFSGKYKSLFLANQGAKKQRLEALVDAIAEVYASIFSPDPILYRSERGLLDVHEEMGVMIQEVVGERVGRYFFPAFSGVAFSNNEFRWSPRIRREDGLVRMVPGLGTRAVDRISDDYPVLLAPGQPGLRVNVTLDEMVRYAPRKMDLIDLEANAFCTVDIKTVLAECGDDYPAVRRIVSILEGDRTRPPQGLEPRWDQDELVVTFEGLFTQTPFVAQVGGLLKRLQEKMQTPVDIEFACDGKHFYLLQCRAQSYSREYAPAVIPRNVPSDRILFSANRYVSNGQVPNISHIVYVAPESYARLVDSGEMKDVGRAVGRLNQVLPSRKFILLGPGRWGSRGDIKLGVSVTYADICNAAALVEVAMQQGDFTPQLSFGTHFFQDLVEAEIRYIPLYPDDPGVEFNASFFRGAKNILGDVAPEYKHLENVVRLIDVPREADGKFLHILMNADLDEAFGILSDPS